MAVVIGVSAGAILVAPSIAPPDLSHVAGALERGELPMEVLLIGTVIALAAGVALPLLAAALRSPQRSVAIPDPAPPEKSESEPRVLDRVPVATRPPEVPRDAAEAEALAAWEAVADAGAHLQPAAGAALAARRNDVPGNATDPAWIVPVEPLKSAPARSAAPAIGSPEAPLIVELRGERVSRRVGPNLPLVAAIGTVAVGVAFSAGAAVGATLGVGVGAAIGLAFAGGAGAAIAATVALIGGRRS